MRTAFVAVILAVALALSPAAFAKMGSGKSFGSRGARTVDRPIERTITPPPAPTPSFQPGPSLAPPLVQPGYSQGSPFLSGMAGGLLGAGIGSMLFGHSAGWAAASEASPVGSLFGLLLQLALVGGIIWLGVRLFRGATQAAGSPRRQASPLRQPIDVPYRVVGGSAAALPKPRVAKEFEPSDVDKQAFGTILIDVQKAWTDGDIGALRQLATPEVVSWLADDLSRNVSQGVRNVVDQIGLQKGEVIEAWRDGQIDYATAVLSFTARDFTVSGAGAVVAGDPHAPTQSTEAWTFLRAPGGRWLLSAVERE